jgi:prevent-host-death family protein
MPTEQLTDELSGLCYMYNSENTGKNTEMAMKISIAEFIRHFGQFHDQAQKKPLVLTKHGRDTVVVISVETFERLTTMADPRRVYSAGETPPELAEILISELDRQSAEYQANEDE